MIKQAAFVLLLVCGNGGVATAAVVFSVLVDSGLAGPSSVTISPFVFEYDGISQLRNDPFTSAVFKVPSLTPLIKSATEFEIVIDYFDGGLTQTITQGQNNVGFAFNSIELGDGSGAFKTLLLSNATPIRTPPSELYSWDTSANLIAGSNLGDPFATPQSRSDRTASVRATYSAGVGENLLLFNPTEVNFSANWFVNDGGAPLDITLSAVPEPSSLAVSIGALMGLGLFGRHNRRRTASTRV